MNKLKIAVQMDSIDTVDKDSDTTIILMHEAQNRGHSLYYYTTDNIALRDGNVKARLFKIHLDDSKNPFYNIGKSREIDLSTMDVILMRQDPPFDMNYLTYTYFLDMIAKKTMVVNSPQSVRDCPEKIMVTKFKEFTPPTVITRDKNQIIQFFDKHKDVVAKPLYAHGGKDIFHIDSYKNNFNAIIDSLLNNYNEPIIVQKYLKNIIKGDKRIILIDGEFVGAINRVPQKGDIRSNLVQGGEAKKTKLTTREKQICEAIAPELKQRNIMLAGIDVIDGYLTEINITSPTGIKSINNFNNTKLEVIFWDKVESKLRQSQKI